MALMMAKDLELAGKHHSLPVGSTMALGKFQQ